MKLSSNAENHQFAILAINIVFLSVMENVLITVMLNIVNNTACLPLACIDFQMSEKDEWTLKTPTHLGIGKRFILLLFFFFGKRKDERVM